VDAAQGLGGPQYCARPTVAESVSHFAGAGGSTGMFGGYALLPPMRILPPFASLLLGACNAIADDAAATHRRYDEFGRRFISEFHEGGLPRARALIKPGTLQRVTKPDRGFEQMRGLLPPGPIDSIRPADGAEIEEGWFSGVGLMRYRVYGAGRIAEVDLWIERSRKHMLVETVRVKSVASPAATPGVAADSQPE
jgi:hypothetical protein